MFNLGKGRQLPALLLIDDDLVSREVMATMLIMCGYIVHTAEDGAAALELLEARECAPEAILMDAQMPGLSGVRLIEELRARTRAFVVAISASKPPDEVVAAADAFLPKPFDARDLDRLLTERQARAAQPPEAPERNSTPEPPEPSPAAADPVVSAVTLAQLRELMPDSGVREIYAAIVADLAQKTDALEIAIVKGDMDEVRRIGHAIKGGCAMAGAMQAARLGALLEASTGSAGGDQVNNMARLLAALRDAARSLERMLKAEFPA